MLPEAGQHHAVAASAKQEDAGPETGPQLMPQRSGRRPGPVNAAAGTVGAHAEPLQEPAAVSMPHALRQSFSGTLQPAEEPARDLEDVWRHLKMLEKAVKAHMTGTKPPQTTQGIGSCGGGSILAAVAASASRSGAMGASDGSGSDSSPGSTARQSERARLRNSLSLLKSEIADKAVKEVEAQLLQQRVSSLEATLAGLASGGFVVAGGGYPMQGSTFSGSSVLGAQGTGYTHQQHWLPKPTRGEPAPADVSILFDRLGDMESAMKHLAHAQAASSVVLSEIGGRLGPSPIPAPAMASAGASPVLAGMVRRPPSCPLTGGLLNGVGVVSPPGVRHQPRARALTPDPYESPSSSGPYFGFLGTPSMASAPSRPSLGSQGHVGAVPTSPAPAATRPYMQPLQQQQQQLWPPQHTDWLNQCAEQQQWQVDVMLAGHDAELAGVKEAIKQLEDLQQMSAAASSEAALRIADLDQRVHLLEQAAAEPQPGPAAAKAPSPVHDGITGVEALVTVATAGGRPAQRSSSSSGSGPLDCADLLTAIEGLAGDASQESSRLTNLESASEQQRQQLDNVCTQADQLAERVDQAHNGMLKLTSVVEGWQQAAMSTQVAQPHSQTALHQQLLSSSQLEELINARVQHAVAAQLASLTVHPSTASTAASVGCTTDPTAAASAASASSLTQPLKAAFDHLSEKLAGLQAHAAAGQAEVIQDALQQLHGRLVAVEDTVQHLLQQQVLGGEQQKLAMVGSAVPPAATTQVAAAITGEEGAAVAEPTAAQVAPVQLEEPCSRISEASNPTKQLTQETAGCLQLKEAYPEATVVAPREAERSPLGSLDQIEAQLASPALAGAAAAAATAPMASAQSSRNASAMQLEQQMAALQQEMTGYQLQAMQNALEEMGKRVQQLQQQQAEQSVLLDAQKASAGASFALLAPLEPKVGELSGQTSSLATQVAALHELVAQQPARFEMLQLEIEQLSQQLTEVNEAAAEEPDVDELRSQLGQLQQQQEQMRQELTAEIQAAAEAAAAAAAATVSLASQVQEDAAAAELEQQQHIEKLLKERLTAAEVSALVQQQLNCMHTGLTQLQEQVDQQVAGVKEQAAAAAAAAASRLAVVDKLAAQTNELADKLSSLEVRVTDNAAASQAQLVQQGEDIRAAVAEASAHDVDLRAQLREQVNTMAQILAEVGANKAEHAETTKAIQQQVDSLDEAHQQMQTDYASQQESLTGQMNLHAQQLKAELSTAIAPLQSQLSAAAATLEEHDTALQGACAASAAIQVLQTLPQTVEGLSARLDELAQAQRAAEGELSATTEQNLVLDQQLALLQAQLQALTDSLAEQRDQHAQQVQQMRQNVLQPVLQELERLQQHKQQLQQLQAEQAAAVEGLAAAVQGVRSDVLAELARDRQQLVAAAEALEDLQGIVQERCVKTEQLGTIFAARDNMYGAWLKMQAVFDANKLPRGSSVAGGRASSSSSLIKPRVSLAMDRAPSAAGAASASSSALAFDPFVELLARDAPEVQQQEHEASAAFAGPAVSELTDVVNAQSQLREEVGSLAIQLHAAIADLTEQLTALRQLQHGSAGSADAAGGAPLQQQQPDSSGVLHAPLSLVVQLQQELSTLKEEIVTKDQFAAVIRMVKELRGQSSEVSSPVVHAGCSPQAILRMLVPGCTGTAADVDTVVSTADMAASNSQVAEMLQQCSGQLAAMESSVEALTCRLEGIERQQQQSSNSKDLQQQQKQDGEILGGRIAALEADVHSHAAACSSSLSCAEDAQQRVQQLSDLHASLKAELSKLSGHVNDLTGQLHSVTNAAAAHPRSSSLADTPRGFSEMVAGLANLKSCLDQQADSTRELSARMDEHESMLQALAPPAPPAEAGAQYEQQAVVAQGVQFAVSNNSSGSASSEGLCQLAAQVAEIQAKLLALESLPGQPTQAVPLLSSRTEAADGPQDAGLLHASRCLSRASSTAEADGGEIELQPAESAGGDADETGRQPLGFVHGVLVKLKKRVDRLEATVVELRLSNIATEPATTAAATAASTGPGSVTATTAALAAGTTTSRAGLTDQTWAARAMEQDLTLSEMQTWAVALQSEVTRLGQHSYSLTATMDSLRGDIGAAAAAAAAATTAARPGSALSVAAGVEADVGLALPHNFDAAALTAEVAAATAAVAQAMAEASHAQAATVDAHVSICTLSEQVQHIQQLLDAAGISAEQAQKQQQQQRQQGVHDAGSQATAISKDTSARLEAQVCALQVEVTDLSSSSKAAESGVQDVRAKLAALQEQVGRAVASAAAGAAAAAVPATAAVVKEELQGQLSDMVHQLAAGARTPTALSHCSNCGSEAGTRRGSFRNLAALDQESHESPAAAAAERLCLHGAQMLSSHEEGGPIHAATFSSDVATALWKAVAELKSQLLQLNEGFATAQQAPEAAPASSMDSDDMERVKQQLLSQLTTMQEAWAQAAGSQVAAAAAPAIAAEAEKAVHELKGRLAELQAKVTQASSDAAVAAAAATAAVSSAASAAQGELQADSLKAELKSLKANLASLQQQMQQLAAVPQPSGAYGVTAAPGTGNVESLLEAERAVLDGSSSDLCSLEHNLSFGDIAAGHAATLEGQLQNNASGASPSQAAGVAAAAGTSTLVAGAANIQGSCNSEPVDVSMQQLLNELVALPPAQQAAFLAKLAGVVSSHAARLLATYHDDNEASQSLCQVQQLLASITAATAAAPTSPGAAAAASGSASFARRISPCSSSLGSAACRPPAASRRVSATYSFAAAGNCSGAGEMLLCILDQVAALRAIGSTTHPAISQALQKHEEQIAKLHQAQEGLAAAMTALGPDVAAAIASSEPPAAVEAGGCSEEGSTDKPLSAAAQQDPEDAPAGPSFRATAGAATAAEEAYEGGAAHRLAGMESRLAAGLKLLSTVKGRLAPLQEVADATQCMMRELQVAHGLTLQRLEALEGLAAVGAAATATAADRGTASGGDAGQQQDAASGGSDVQQQQANGVLAAAGCLRRLQEDVSAVTRRLSSFEAAVASHSECLVLARRLSARQADFDARHSMLVSKVSGFSGLLPVVVDKVGELEGRLTCSLAIAKQGLDILADQLVALGALSGRTSPSKNPLAALGPHHAAITALDGKVEAVRTAMTASVKLMIQELAASAATAGRIKASPGMGSGELGAGLLAMQVAASEAARAAAASYEEVMTQLEAKLTDLRAELKSSVATMQQPPQQHLPTEHQQQE